MTRRDLLAALPALVAGGAASGSAAGANALKVGAALPDPPFEFINQSGPSGFDIALMQRIAGKLGRAWQLVRYEGADFNGISPGWIPVPMTASRPARPSRPRAKRSPISARLMRCPGNRWWSMRRGFRRYTASTTLPAW